MKLPLDISARDMRINEETEELIRDKASKLDRIYDQIIGCRVKIDKPHRSQRTGMTFNVSIDITIPGHELVIKRESDQDLRVAIMSSFETAQRRLKEYAEKQRGEVKTHFEKPVARVIRIFPEEGYGFLATPEGREVYFHENAVLGGKFQALNVGSEVSFTEEQGDEGAQAISVSPA
ncbi:MAG: HPF/RaiA family ribosome-associated protein [Syntrophobacteraceae bacterium]|nr:HPF/RaiA family ribosome-associated protein [Syntrophobacteraceae bacterium]